MFDDVLVNAIETDNQTLVSRPAAAAFLDSPPRFQSAEKFEFVEVRDEKYVLSTVTTVPTVTLARAKLVALTSWSFTCEGDGDFMMLMQHLDVGLVGKTKGNKPPVTDTGHIRVEHGTRAGTKETALFRGPLVPMPLQRDTAGPYHSADQARRVAPEIGLQDLSYACAFEVGRLIAAADARLAQELMRWRRKGFRASARLDVMADIEKRLDVVLAEAIPQKLQRYVLPVVAGELVKTFAASGPPVGDPFGMGLVAKTTGLQPELFAKAFALDGGVDAGRDALLGIASPLATRVPAVAEPVLKGGTLAEVLKDAQGLAALHDTRTQVIDNVRTRIDTIGKLGGPTFDRRQGRRQDERQAMKQPWVSSKAALNERLVAHQQVDAPSQEAQMPPYMETFLSHLRLLIGVPFDYLVPDARMLPIESIRFFYLDRSWTDRLVDGAIAVGKIGSREQAHHQARAPYVSRQLDITERHVRDLQRRRLEFGDLVKLPLPGAADRVTGFLMRSRAVSGWPQMDVRAYRFDGTVGANNPPRNFDPADPAIKAKQLTDLAPRAARAGRHDRACSRASRTW